MVPFSTFYLNTFLIMFTRPEEPENFDRYDEPRIHMERLMKAHLVDFPLSLRILIPLESAGIRRLGDLLKCTRTQLAAIPLIGANALDKIEKCLAEYNLFLRKE